MTWITEDNLPQIAAAVFSMTTVYLLRDVFKNWRWWRKGASQREKDTIAYTAHQLERCNEELDETQIERDHYLRQVGRRDHIILSNGLRVPHDGRRPDRNP